MQSNTSFYLKNRALDGFSLVFLVSRLINSLLGPQNVIGCYD